jgi:hypothetical protein
MADNRLGRVITTRRHVATGAHEPGGNQKLIRPNEGEGETGDQPGPLEGIHAGCAAPGGHGIRPRDSRKGHRATRGAARRRCRGRLPVCGGETTRARDAWPGCERRRARVCGWRRCPAANADARRRARTRSSSAHGSCSRHRRCGCTRFASGCDRQGETHGRRPSRTLPFVGDGEPLAALGAAALQDEPAVLRSHTHQKAMGLLPAARVRLVCALTLCHYSIVLRTSKCSRLLIRVSTHHPLWSCQKRADMG